MVKKPSKNYIRLTKQIPDLEEHIQQTIGRYTVKSPQENTVEFTDDMPF